MVSRYFVREALIEAVEAELEEMVDYVRHNLRLFVKSFNVGRASVEDLDRH